MTHDARDQAWPFLISKAKSEGDYNIEYATLVAPDFLCYVGLGYVLHFAISGDMQTPEGVIYRRQIVNLSGAPTLTVLFRLVLATGADIGEGEDSLADLEGRPILHAEGLVFQGDIEDGDGLSITLGDLEQTHCLLMPLFQEFWRHPYRSPVAQPIQSVRLPVSVGAPLKIIEKNGFDENAYDADRHKPKEKEKSSFSSPPTGESAVPGDVEARLSQHRFLPVETSAEQASNLWKASDSKRGSMSTKSSTPIYGKLLLPVLTLVLVLSGANLFLLTKIATTPQPKENTDQLKVALQSIKAMQSLVAEQKKELDEIKQIVQTP